MDKMKNIFFGLLILGIISACTTTTNKLTKEEDPKQENSKNFTSAPVEKIDIQILESFPVKVQVVVNGQFSDGCGELDKINTVKDGNKFTISISSKYVDPETVCTHALVPFEEIIPLNVKGLKAGTYTVNVNGISKSFNLDADN